MKRVRSNWVLSVTGLFAAGALVFSSFAGAVDLPQAHASTAHTHTTHTGNTPGGSIAARDATGPAIINDVVQLQNWNGNPIPATAARATDASVASGVVQKYLGGERAGDAGLYCNAKPSIGGVNVYGRYQDSDGAWSPVFYTVSKNETKREGSRCVNYRLWFMPFKDYAGKEHRFEPHKDGKARRIQIWVDESEDYRLAFSERSGGVIQGYSQSESITNTRNGGNQIMLWNVNSNSTTVEQLNIGVIRVAKKDWVKANVINPSSTDRRARKLSGKVRWEYRTLDKTGSLSQGAKPNLDYPQENKGAKGFVVLVRVGDHNSGTYYWTRTDQNGNWTIKAEGVVHSVLSAKDAGNISVQLYDVTSATGKSPDETITPADLVPLSPDMGYWTPFSQGLEPNDYASGWNPSGAGITNFPSGYPENMIFNVRPSDMRVAVGTDQYKQDTERYEKPYDDMGHNAGPKETLKIYVKGVPAAPGKKLKAVLYKGQVHDEHTGVSPTKVAEQTIDIDETINGKKGLGLHGGEGEAVFGSFKFKDSIDTQYWIDVVDPDITENEHKHVFASYSFKYSPVYLSVYDNQIQKPESGNLATGQAYAEIENSWVGDHTTGAKIKCDGSAEVVSKPNTASGIEFNPADCSLSGSPQYSGLITFRLKANATLENLQEVKKQIYTVYYPVKPGIKPQMSGAVATDEESPVPKQARINQEYNYFIKASKEEDGSLAERIVKQNGAPLTPLKNNDPKTNGTYDLGKGLYLNPGSLEIFGTPDSEGTVKFTLELENKHGKSSPRDFTIDVGTPITLQDANAPTLVAGSDPIHIRAKGGREEFSDQAVAYYEQAKWEEEDRELLVLVAQAKALGLDLTTKTKSQGVKSGEILEINPKDLNIEQLTTLYLPVDIRDNAGRILSGQSTPIETVRAKNLLDGTEGWVKITLVPKAIMKNPKLPDGTKGQVYPQIDLKKQIENGKDQTLKDSYTYRATGLPAGMYMTTGGILAGTPEESTPPEGKDITITLTGKSGSKVEGVTQELNVKLVVKTNFKFEPGPIEVTAKGGEVYSSENPLLRSSTYLKGSSGVVTYRVQKKESGNWKDLQNGDLGNGLTLNPNTGHLIGTTIGNDAAGTMYRIVASNQDTISCSPAQYCEAEIEVNLKRVDDRRPQITTTHLTAEANSDNSTVQGNLHITGGSGQWERVTLEKTDAWPEAVTLTTDQVTPGGYTLQVTDTAPSNFKVFNLALKVIVLDKNGNSAEKYLNLVVTDVRDVALSAGEINLPEMEEGIALETGSNAPSVAGIVDSNTTPIRCYTLAPVDPATDPTMLCPTSLIDLGTHSMPGLKLDPKTGVISGSPAQDSAGTYPLPVVAVAQNGKTAQKNVNITIKETTLDFEPGFSKPGTIKEPYIWAFKAATGGPEPKTYRILDSNSKPIENCQVTVPAGAKPTLNCSPSGFLQTAAGKGHLILEVSAGTAPSQIKKSVELTIDFKDPVIFKTRALPGGAKGLVYNQDNALVRLEAKGGNGGYNFKPGKNAKTEENGNCKGQYSLKLEDGRASGLCLNKDGTITGTPTAIGTVNLTDVEVKDQAGRKGTWGLNHTNPNLQIKIVEPVTLKSLYPSAEPFPCDPSTSQQCKYLKITKNEELSSNIATYTVGSDENVKFEIKGHKKFSQDQNNPTLHMERVKDSSGKYIRLKGKATVITSVPEALQIVITDQNTGQIVSEDVYILVETDLKFTKDPKVENKNINIAASDGKTKPSSIKDEDWEKVKDQVQNDKPTLGIHINEKQLDQNPAAQVKVPKLTKGGVEPITYTTENCDNTDSDGNCAIGDTGLFLNKNTGEIIGVPQPGSTVVVVIVADSDFPPQRKKANLVVSVADNRLPEVAENQVFKLDKKNNASQAQVNLTAGSGKYANCEIEKLTPEASWIEAKMDGQSCKLRFQKIPSDYSATALRVKIKVTDANGKTNHPNNVNAVPDKQAVTIEITDTRLPKIPQEIGDFTVKEGEKVKPSWPALKTGQGQPKITKWQVEGLPNDVIFDPNTGQITGTASTKMVGEYEIVVTATAENGQIISKKVKFTVEDSGLVLLIPNFPQAEAGHAYPKPSAGQLTLGIEGTCNDCTYSVVSSKIDSTQETPYKPTVVPATGELTFKNWPASGQDNVHITFRVQNADGTVWREKTAVIAADNHLRVSNLTMTPIYKNQAAHHCVRVIGSAGNYNFRVKVDSKDFRANPVPNNPNRLCFDIPENTITTTGFKKLKYTVTSGTDTANGELILHVKGAIVLNDKTVEVKKNESVNLGMSDSAMMTDDTCFALSTDTECRPDSDIETKWELVGAPEGISINQQSGLITGSLDKLYDDKFVVKFTKTLEDDSATGSATITLKVTTDLTAPADRTHLGEVEITKDGTAKLKPVAVSGTGNSMAPSEQLLPDLKGKGTYVIDGVDPDAQGNYPIKIGDKDTGLAITPDGKLVGTLKPGVIDNLKTINLAVKVQDNEGGDPVGPSNVTFTIKDERKPKALSTTDNVIQVEVGQSQNGQFPFKGGSGAKAIDNPYSITDPGSQRCPLKIDDVDGVKSWVFDAGWRSDDPIGKNGKEFTCQVTLKDFNGQTSPGNVKVKVTDQRKPSFANGSTNRYTWQGHVVPKFPVTVKSANVADSPAWVINGDNNKHTELDTVTFSTLPGGLKLYKDKEAATQPVIPASDGTYTCNIKGGDACLLTGIPDATSKGGHDLLITATGVNGQVNERNVHVGVYGPALEVALKHEEGRIPTVTADEAFTLTVAKAGYGKPFDMIQEKWDELKHKPSCNLARSYALSKFTAPHGTETGPFSNEEPGKVEVTSDIGLTGTLEASDESFLPQDSGCESLDLKWQNIVLSAPAEKVKKGDYPVTVKVTDGRGISATLKVTITVLDKLAFLNPPFTGEPDTAAELRRAVTGQPYKSPGGTDYRGTVSGGDGKYQTVGLKKELTGFTAKDLDVKAWGKKEDPGRSDYKGIEPIFCKYQVDKGRDDRPKCMPLPDLAPDAYPGNAYNKRYEGEGLFQLTDGNIVGTVPKNTASGKHTYRLAVRDGDGRFVTKLITIPVVKNITMSHVQAGPPNAEKQKQYDPQDLFTIEGGSAESAGAGSPDYSGYHCNLSPSIAGMTCKVDADGHVKLEGTPTQAFEGTLTATVKETGIPDGVKPLTIRHSFEFEVDSNMKFKETDPNAPSASGYITVTPPSASVTKPVVNIAANANGDNVKHDDALRLDVENGVTDGTYGTEEGLKYWIEDATGNKVFPSTCPPETPEHPIRNGSPVESVNIQCYPLSDTGLFFTSDGKIVGNAMPGKTAPSLVVVVADNDQPVRTKKAELNLSIEDRRPGTVNELTFEINVGEDLSGKQVTINKVTDLKDSSRVAENLKVSSNLGDLVSSMPKDDDGTPIGKECTPKNPDDTEPGWLQINAQGNLSGTVDANKDNANYGIYQKCVWYVGENGVASSPVKVTVQVRDSRTFDTSAAGGAPGGAPQVIQARQGELVGTASSPKKVEFGTLDESLVQGMKIETYVSDSSGGGKWSAPVDAPLTDKSVDGLTVKGLVCEPSSSAQNKATCKLEISGTPTKKAVGTHELQYRITLANRQQTVVSQTIKVEPYLMDLKVPDVMAVALVGKEYLNNHPIEVATNAANIKVQFTGLPDGLDGSVPSGNSISSDEYLYTLDLSGQAAALNGESHKTYQVTVTAFDADKCTTGPSGCDFSDTKTLKITVVSKQDEEPLKLEIPVNSGSANSGNIFNPNPKLIDGATQDIRHIDISNPDVSEDVVSSKIKLVDNRIVVDPSGLPEGTYTVTVVTTLPGGQTVSRKVTVKINPKASPSSPGGSGGSSGYGGHGGHGSLEGFFDNYNKIVRHGGQTRVETALSVLDYFGENSSYGDNRLQKIAYSEYAQKVNMPWSDTAVLVRQDDFADALVAGVLADELNAPILVSDPKIIRHIVLDTLRDKGFKRVVIVGREHAISAGIEVQLKDRGIAVERIGGENRYQTAVQVADRVLKERGTQNSDVLMANGTNFPDALSASSAAIKNKAVVLLTNDENIIKQTRSWVTSQKTTKVTAIGGPAARATEQSAGIQMDGSLVGKDRYETAQLVADTMFPPGPGRVAIATGTDFPDVTVGVTITSRTGAPMLMTKPQKLVNSARGYLSKNSSSILQVDILGGVKALGMDTRNQIAVSIGNDKNSDTPQKSSEQKQKSE